MAWVLPVDAHAVERCLQHLLLCQHITKQCLRYRSARAVPRVAMEGSSVSDAWMPEGASCS
jgi:hypothetical protein